MYASSWWWWRSTIPPDLWKSCDMHSWRNWRKFRFGVTQIAQKTLDLLFTDPSMSVVSKKRSMGVDVEWQIHQRPLLAAYFRNKFHCSSLIKVQFKITHLGNAWKQSTNPRIWSFGTWTMQRYVPEMNILDITKRYLWITWTASFLRNAVQMCRSAISWNLGNFNKFWSQEMVWSWSMFWARGDN